LLIFTVYAYHFYSTDLQANRQPTTHIGQLTEDNSAMSKSPAHVPNQWRIQLSTTLCKQWRSRTAVLGEEYDLYQQKAYFQTNVPFFIRVYATNSSIYKYSQMYFQGLAQCLLK